MSRRPIAAAALAASLVLLATDARLSAKETSLQTPTNVGATTTSEAPGRPYTLLVDPLYLVSQLGMVTGETTLRGKWDIALTTGAGWNESSSPGLTTHVLNLLAGAQIYYYLFGNHRTGMQLGAEVLYQHYRSPFVHQYPVHGDVLYVGPFVGYKHVWDVGFTFECQAGYQVNAGRQIAWSDDAPANTWVGSGLLLHVRVGWTF